jgi:N-methylhydantoinase B
METRFPLLFEKHEFRKGSAGAGKYRGGYGVSLALKLEIEEPASAVAAGEGKHHAPFGLFGGTAGLPHSYGRKPPGSSQIIDIATKTVDLTFEPGEVLIIESAGGGGYGNSAERPAHLKALDEKSGLEQMVED